ncbi:hypothetical protein HMPREF0063_12922 [Aeromicrobium marinum DSM 15272]|uniref:Uncharacterized protein n=1 Tax=Aeromicrobium marinum DSM 15272 TaxID=585531 RepID=E2SFW3_9ACTN|nr:hypothetical protein [Aeromicrobium marinum]EFQ81910.1 hypothetical protein HMPREF0063_12922 [Aeromicrobium marinum DSM 15272]
MTLIRPSGTVAVLLTALLALGACGTDSITIPDGTGGSVSVDTDDGDFSVETDEGSVVGGTDLPDDFPTDEVPLIDGTITSGTSVNDAAAGANGFTVSVQVDRSVADAADEAGELLLGAGFTSGGTMSSGDFSQGSYVGEKWQVVVSASPDFVDGKAVVTYIVVAEGS